MKRSCGILMPIFSLPSSYGIGTMGRKAYEFVDFLKKAGQGYWQVLPLNPTSYGDSPYQSFSVFAGNPYFIDITLLIEDGLLKKTEAEEFTFSNDPRYVDYELIYNSRFDLLRIAKERGFKRDAEEIERFICKNQTWLPDYTLFMALKRHFDMKSWTEWEDEDIKLHKEGAIREYREILREDIEFFTYLQYLFFKQWEELKAYANSNGIRFIGDLPIYVAMDSVDCWANPEQFQLDEKNVPIAVSGVPPDYFSEDGQLWGNPLYNWEEMEQQGYSWWLKRIGNASKLYDVIRIDHFRGIESYWAVPFGESTARNGRWIKGPGLHFVNSLKEAFPKLEIIAEDLGCLTEGVHELLAASGFPGMKVLEFAFNANEQSDYLPHNHVTNCVCYTGTHDNSPLMLWLKEANGEDIAFAMSYLGISDDEGFNWGMIRGGMSSVADLFIAQMQDYLELSHRTNTPGVQGGNWKWRMLEGENSNELAERINKYARMYGRS